MNLNQLTYFVTLAQIENYTRAAKRLDITQPSLSHAISNLEKELKVPLFERHGRNVTMTKYGENVSEICAGLLTYPESWGGENTGSGKNSGRKYFHRVHPYPGTPVYPGACPRVSE